MCAPVFLSWIVKDPQDPVAGSSSLRGSAPAAGVETGERVTAGAEVGVAVGVRGFGFSGAAAVAVAAGSGYMYGREARTARGEREGVLCFVREMARPRICRPTKYTRDRMAVPCVAIA